jgi:hypothetical protein
MHIILLKEPYSGVTQVGCANLLNGNPADRWYDKHVLVVDAAGGLGMVYDHSSTDGHAWQRLVNETMSDMMGLKSGYTPLPELPLRSDAPTIVQLKFELTDLANEALVRTLKENAALSKRVDLDAYIFFDFGKNEIKKWGLSPDGVVQLAMKYAYFLLLGRERGLPATYETGLTRR